MTLPLMCLRRARALFLIGSTVFLLGGCGSGQPTSGAQSDGGALQGAPDGPMVAVVNGERVTQPVLDVFAGGRGLDVAEPAQRQQALDALIESLLLAQAALAGPLSTQPDVQAELALVRVQQLSLRQLGALGSEVELSEQELRDYYSSEVERSGRIEFKAQHILFADEATATTALAEATAAGADFNALMQKYQGSALQAADLGWANRAQTPPEFAEVFAQLGDGEVAPVLVQTRFGFHVLKRETSREFTPPPFEQVREGVLQQLTQQAVADRVRALRSTATISAPGSSAAATP